MYKALLTNYSALLTQIKTDVAFGSLHPVMDANYANGLYSVNSFDSSFVSHSYSHRVDTGYITSTTAGTVLNKNLTLFTPPVAINVYAKNIHWLLHDKLYRTVPERYASVFSNIYDENFSTTSVGNDRWSICGIPFLVGDTISYMINITPAIGQKYALQNPTTRKYKVQLKIV